MLRNKKVSPPTLTKQDFGPNELRRAIADELGLKISTVYAWVSNTRDVPDKHIQTVCDVINAFNHTMSASYQSERNVES